MRMIEINSMEFFKTGRWRVEIFTDDNSADISSRWPCVRIGDIAAESSTAVNPQECGQEDFYYVGLENVESVTGDSVNIQKKKRGEVKSRSKVFAKDYVLYGRLRPYLRKVFVTDGPYESGLCSTEFIVLKPAKDKVLPEVLRAILASEIIGNQLARLQIGAALPRVSADDFMRATVPLPPMSVQQTMAAKLAKLRKERLSLKARLVENPLEVDRVVSDLVTA